MSIKHVLSIAGAILFLPWQAMPVSAADAAADAPQKLAPGEKKPWKSSTDPAANVDGSVHSRPDRVSEYDSIRELLNAEQKPKFEAILETSRTRNEPVLAEMHDIRKQLRKAPDDNGLNTKMEKIQQQLRDNRADTRAKIHELLTSDQKTKLKAMRLEQADHGGKWSRTEASDGRVRHRRAASEARQGAADESSKESTGSEPKSNSK